MIKDSEEWGKLNAQERQSKYDSAVEEFRGSQGAIFDGLIKPLSPETFWIIKELAFGDTSICERCEDRVPELLMFEAYDDEQLENSPEKIALENMSIEWSCCTHCIEEDKLRVCANCGRSEYHVGKLSPCVKYKWTEGVRVEINFEAHNFRIKPCYEVKQ